MDFLFPQCVREEGARREAEGDSVWNDLRGALRKHYGRSSLGLRKAFVSPLGSSLRCLTFTKYKFLRLGFWDPLWNADDFGLVLGWGVNGRFWRAAGRDAKGFSVGRSRGYAGGAAR